MLKIKVTAPLAIYLKTTVKMIVFHPLSILQKKPTFAPDLRRSLSISND